MDAMQEMWNRRGWNKNPIDQDFRTECQQWLELLLSLVDVTVPSAPALLKKFLTQSQGVLGDTAFRAYVTKKVLHIILCFEMGCSSIVASLNSNIIMICA